MKRGDVYSVSGGGDYLGKPRPAVVIQKHDFPGLSSITICPLTSCSKELQPKGLQPFRPLIEPSARNGLNAPSNIMADKITAAKKNKLGQRIGELDDEDLARLERAMTVFLGLES